MCLHFWDAHTTTSKREFDEDDNWSLWRTQTWIRKTEYMGNNLSHVSTYRASFDIYQEEWAALGSINNRWTTKRQINLPFSLTYMSSALESLSTFHLPWLASGSLYIPLQICLLPPSFPLFTVLLDVLLNVGFVCFLNLLIDILTTIIFDITYTF